MNRYRSKLAGGFLSPAQSVVPGTIDLSPQQCVWRAGNDPAWAAPSLDETAWQPYTEWKLNPSQAHMWVRCHADLSPLREVADPAIQVSLWAAYQLYVNGALAGGAGNLHSGNFSMNTVRSFPLSGDMHHSATIALNITWRLAGRVPASALPPLEVSAGARSALRAQRADRLLVESAPHLFPAIGFTIVGVLGFIAFGLFSYDPSHRELFLLALYSICLACTYLDYLLAPALVAYPSAIYLAVWSFSVSAIAVTRPAFFFALARRHVPLVFWILIAFSVLLYVPTGVCVLLSPAQSLWLDFFQVRYLSSSRFLALMATSTAPFFAFWPYSQITRRMWPLAGLCLLWGATDAALFAVRATALGGIPGVPDLVTHWDLAVSETRALVELCAMAALFALLFHEQRQIALDRALLAGEMQAASEIQRMLAPEKIDTAHGLRIEVTFLPMREVGGDFYLCRVLPDGRQRILLGDVSGKGAAAAMAATLLIGAASRRDSDSPSELLHHLNLVLRDSGVGGLATCFCADVEQTGELILANAGHLAPYFRGEELNVPSGLPLGITAESSYNEIALALEASGTITFLSDGVVEARNAAGELFGFERAQELSSRPAPEMARAARAFGQEDDITVLTLTFAPAEVAHA